MSDNQYVFEIIRDVGFLIQDIKENETVWFHVKNDGKNFFTFRSSKGVCGGLSETSFAIEKAYQVTRGRPDPRDARIKELEKMLEKKLDLIKCGVAHNYSGDPYENKLYTEARELLLAV